MHSWSPAAVVAVVVVVVVVVVAADADVSADRSVAFRTVRSGENLTSTLNGLKGNRDSNS